MFLLHKPLSLLTEREKLLHDSVVRSHAARVGHAKRKLKNPSRRRFRGGSCTYMSENPAKAVFPTMVDRHPRSPLLLGLYKQPKIDGFVYFLDCGLPNIAVVEDWPFWSGILLLIVYSNSEL
jgi:hypothetical protein